jgi:hypothetical protein
MTSQVFGQGCPRDWTLRQTGDGHEVVKADLQRDWRVDTVTNHNRRPAPDFFPSSPAHLIVFSTQNSPWRRRFRKVHRRQRLVLSLTVPAHLTMLRTKLFILLGVLAAATTLLAVEINTESPSKVRMPSFFRSINTC